MTGEQSLHALDQPFRHLVPYAHFHIPLRYLHTTENSATMSPFDGARNTAVSTLLGRRDDLVSGAITRVVSERLQRAGDERPVVACVSLTKQAGAVEAKAVADALAHLAHYAVTRSP